MSLNAKVMPIIVAPKDEYSRSDIKPEEASQSKKGIIKRVSEFVVDKYVDVTFPNLSSIDNNDLRKWNVFWPVVLIFQGAFIGIFAYLLYSGYESNVNDTFLSPAGQYSTGQVCESVLITLSSSFLIDTNGYWEGSSDFSYSNALYRVSFQNVALTNNDYKSTIALFESYLHQLESKMVNRGLEYNLVVWSSLRRTYKINGGHVRFSSVGEARKLFNLEYYAGAIVQRNAYCLPTPSNAWTYSYDYYTSKITVSIPITASYSQGGSVSYTEPCGMFETSTDFYYDPLFDSSLKIKIDSRSLTTAIAVNYGITNIDALSGIEITRIGNYYYGLFFDENYPDMDPVFCFSMPSTTLYRSKYSSSVSPTETPYNISSGNYPVGCLLTYRNQFFYPYFDHVGNSETCWYGNSKCDVSDSTDTASDCNSQSQTIGLAFFASRDGGLFSLVDFANEMQYLISTNSTHGDLTVANSAFTVINNGVGINKWSNAFGDQAVSKGLMSADQQTCNPSFTSSVASGFNSLAPSRSKLIMLTLGMQSGRKDFLFSQSVNLNSYSSLLYKGAYNNSLYNPKVLKSMTENPPTSLAQQYDTCQYTPFFAFYNALGVAYGNAHLIGLLSIIVSVFTIKFVVNKLASSHSDKIYRPDRKLGLYIRVLNCTLRELVKQVRDSESAYKIEKMVELLEKQEIADSSVFEKIAKDIEVATAIPVSKI